MSRSVVKKWSKSRQKQFRNHKAREALLDPLPFALKTSTLLDASGFVLKASTIQTLH